MKEKTTYNNNETTINKDNREKKTMDRKIQTKRKTTT